MISQNKRIKTSYILRYYIFSSYFLKSDICREKEREELIRLYESREAQFIAIYGRRVGKTYLASSVFDGKFTFQHSGLSPAEGKENGKSLLRSQLNQFYNSLRLYGMGNEKSPKSWMDAFYILEKLHCYPPPFSLPGRWRRIREKGKMLIIE